MLLHWNVLLLIQPEGLLNLPNTMLISDTKRRRKQGHGQAPGAPHGAALCREMGGCSCEWSILVATQASLVGVHVSQQECFDALEKGWGVSQQGPSAGLQNSCSNFRKWHFESLLASRRRGRARRGYRGGMGQRVPKRDSAWAIGCAHQATGMRP